MPGMNRRLRQLASLLRRPSVTEQGRRAKFYAITAKGRRQLTAETRELATFIAAITPVLLPA
jgi:DNA-binding PadR family transcriptional regulator